MPKRGQILIVILTTIRDYPLMRPCWYYRRLKHLKVDGWVRYLKKAEYIVDTGNEMSCAEFDTYCKLNPPPDRPGNAYDKWYAGLPKPVCALKLTEKGLDRISR